MARAKKRQSPGGVADCNGCGKLVTRGQINRLMRARKEWKCSCGSKRIDFSAAYIVRGGPTAPRFMWAHKKRAVARG